MIRFSETKSFTPLQMEAALCAWEAMIEWRWNDESAKRNPDSFPEFQQDMNDQWEGIGIAGMRSVSIQAGHIAERVYALMERAGYEFHSAYDWEFVPAVLSRLDWAALCSDNQFNGPIYRPRLAPILKDMLAKHASDFAGPVLPETKWLDRARTMAETIWCYSGLVDDHIERFQSYRKAGCEPLQAVKEIGEKYDLTPRSEWEGY